jgi:hypothetical protein
MLFFLSVAVTLCHVGDVVGFLAMNVHWGKFSDDALKDGYLKMYGEHRVVRQYCIVFINPNRKVGGLVKTS